MMDEEPMAADFDTERRITRALEAAPQVLPPDDFVAQVMRRLPRTPQPLHPSLYLRQTHYGRNIMLLCALVLCIVLVASAASVTPGSVAWIAAQCVLLVELGAIALWLSFRSMGQRL